MVGAGKLQSSWQLPLSLAWQGASGASLQVAVGKAASLAKEGDGYRLPCGDQACPTGMGKLSLCLKASPGKARGQHTAGQQCPAVFLRVMGAASLTPACVVRCEGITTRALL